MAKVRKSFRLQPSVIAAIHLLMKEDFAFPSNSETGVIEKAVQEAWQRVFPDQEFPQDDDEEVGAS